VLLKKQHRRFIPNDKPIHFKKEDTHMWWGNHGFWFCPIGLLLFVLIAGLIVVRICTIRNYGCRRRWSDDPDAILKRRLASGEIDEAEYQKLKDALKK
jgi:uncharacterized membrane protein